MKNVNWDPSRVQSLPNGLFFRSFDKRSSELERLTPAFVENGLRIKVLRNWLGFRSDMKVSEMVAQGEEKLIMDHVLITVAVWAAGLLLSAALFVGEAGKLRLDFWKSALKWWKRKQTNKASKSEKIKTNKDTDCGALGISE